MTDYFCNSRLTLKEVYGCIHDYVEQHKAQLTDDLITLVRVPSVKGEKEPGAPFGRECARVLEVIRDLFASYGIESEIRPESGYLTADVMQGDRCFGLFGHADVVAVDDSWLLCDPFAAEVRGGFLIGRGSGDDKSGIIASLYAAMAIRDLKLPFQGGIRLVVGSEEETGMSDMKHFIEEQPMPDVSLVPDMIYPVGRGEKGTMRITGVSRKKLTAIRDFTGGQSPNIVLGKATVRFLRTPELEEACSGLGNDFTVEVKDNELFVTAKGISKHAGWPEGSLSAARSMTEVLRTVSALPEEDRAILQNAYELLEGYYGEGLRITEKDPDFGPLTCVNGLVRLKNGHLALSFNIRYGASLHSEKLIGQVRKRLDEMGFDLEEESHADGFIIPKDDSTLQTLLDCYHEVTGVSAPAVLANAGSYARVFRHGAYSTAPYTRRPDAFHLPEGHGYAHQPDEFVAIDGVVNGAAMLGAMLISLDRME